MTNKRYHVLNDDVCAVLTPEEMEGGWHWCDAWDGLLVNQYDTEGEGRACTCFASHA